MDKYLHYVLTNLREITKDCNEDMHEPDNNGVTARVVGTQLDNAWGTDIRGSAVEDDYQEFIVIIKREAPNGQYIERKFNLASLIALARMVPTS